MTLPGGGHGGPGGPEAQGGGPDTPYAPGFGPEGAGRREGAGAGEGALTHFDERGAARMVDVSGKPETARFARARARVEMAPATLARIRDRSLEKGDVCEVARIAGIQGAKRTSELVPLCHPLPLTSVAIDFADDGRSALEITCEARVTGRTGVEMEALTGAAVAALTVYDMVKAIDRGVVIAEVKLIEKAGGRSGHWRRAPGGR
jgi:cyclic pyranopterin phosphate synthase